MVGRRLGGHTAAARARGGDEVRGRPRGKVLQVDVRARLLREREVARHGARLGFVREDAQAERPRERAVAHDALQFRHDRVVHHREAERRRAAHRFAHDGVVRDHGAVVRKRGRARGGEVFERRDVAPGAADRAAPRHEEAHRRTRRRRKIVLFADARRRIERRRRVRHRDHGPDAAARGGREARRDRFGVFAARLPEMHVRIDRGRHREQARAVEDGRARRGRGGDAAAGAEEVGGPVAPRGGVQHADPAERPVGQVRRRRFVHGREV